MTQTQNAPADGAGAETRGLRGMFAAIVVVEILSMAALYWFGRHFS